MPPLWRAEWWHLYNGRVIIKNQYSHALVQNDIKKSLKDQNTDCMRREWCIQGAYDKCSNHVAFWNTGLEQLVLMPLFVIIYEKRVENLLIEFNIVMDESLST